MEISQIFKKILTNYSVIRLINYFYDRKYYLFLIDKKITIKEISLEILIHINFVFCFINLY